jgi:hypothetical protein
MGFPKGIYGDQGIEGRFELGTAPVQDVDFRDTVIQKFLAEIEGLVFLLLVSGVERLAITDRHVVGVVIFSSRVGSHVVLVLFRIEEKREVAFLEFRQSKSDGHLGKGTGQEIVGVNKFQAADFQTQNFAAVENHFRFDAGRMNKTIQNKLTVVSFKVVGNDYDILVLKGQGSPVVGFGL